MRSLLQLDKAGQPFILHPRREMFSRKTEIEIDGCVSVSQISGELGMAKSALYKHYKNKRDIFDSIVERMNQIGSEIIAGMVR